MALRPGVDIDVVTGQPRETREKAHRTQQRAHAEAYVQQGSRVRAALGSPEGSVLRQTIAQLLSDRIDQLMHQDERCIVLLDLLSQWTNDLQVGRRMAVALMAELEEP